VRTISSPARVIPPVTSFSPDWYFFGVSPNSAPTAFDLVIRLGSSTADLKVTATSGPTPGTVISFRQTASSRANLGGLNKVRRGLSGKRIRPCQPATQRTRRAEFMAVARMAVRLGVPIESLTSLAALLHPDVIERVIEAYWQKNGKEPKIFTIDLGWKLLRIARETGCLDQAAVERLDEIRATLEEYRRSGLTPKNLKLVRQVLTEGVWSEVTSLPNILMRQARSAKDHAPTKAALTAQLAVAIAILTFAPVRLPIWSASSWART
jgi:hypothetical protein